MISSVGPCSQKERGVTGLHKKSSVLRKLFQSPESTVLSLTVSAGTQVITWITCILA